MAKDWESIVDQQIRDAQARGDFDHLPGTGQPLELRNEGDPDWWIKQYLERERVNGEDLLPTVVALRKVAQGFPDSLADFTSEAEVRAHLVAYNRQVKEDRLETFRSGASAGTGAFPLLAPLVDVEEMVQEWRLVRAQLPEEDEAPAEVERVPEPRRRRWWRWGRSEARGA